MRLIALADLAVAISKAGTRHFHLLLLSPCLTEPISRPCRSTRRAN